MDLKIAWVVAQRKSGRSALWLKMGAAGIGAFFKSNDLALVVTGFVIMHITMPSVLADPVVLALAVVGIFFTGISKSGFAGGAGVVAVPLLALVISPAVAVVLILPLLLLMDVQTIAHHRRNLAFSELRTIVPAAVVGVGVGTLALGHLNDALLKFLVGLISLAFAGFQLLPQARSRVNVSTRSVLGVIMGLIAGTTSSLIHAGGPPLNIYLATLKMPRALWISTAAVFFAAINFSKVLSYAWAGLWNAQTLLASGLLVPVAILGVYAGHHIQQRISERLFVRIVMLALGSSGLVLMVQSVS